MSEVHATIEAFADGEPVDSAQLLAALAAPEGREHLVDLLALRGLIGGQEPENRCRASVFGPAAENRRPASVFGFGRLLATAALVALGVLGGFMAGQRLAGLRASQPAATAANAPAQLAPMSAPQPTRVIQLENGVDWNEHGGGH